MNLVVSLSNCYLYHGLRRRPLYFSFHPWKQAAMDDSSQLSDALAMAAEKYHQNNRRSQLAHTKAAGYLPGGNTRTSIYNSPFPLVVGRGYDTKLQDVDGHVYTDFLGDYSSALYGHSNQDIKRAMDEAFSNIGVSLGACNELEAKFASTLVDRFPNLDKIRFCNSGTEANIMALVAAKAFTKRQKVIVFRGGYHGGPLTFANGVAPYNINQDSWIIARYNDTNDFSRLIESSNDIAAVLVEGMLGSGGAIPGRPDFLLNIQQKCQQTGAVFILDEVMTSRLGPHGLQGHLGLTPDITTLGKYIGGGFAFGAFGGRAEIMAVFDPTRPGSISHSGTFNNSILTLTAGYTGLTKIYTPMEAVKWNNRANLFRKSINEACANTKMSISGYGSIMCVHFNNQGKVESYEDVTQDIPQLKTLFWMDMLEAGFWIASRGTITFMAILSEQEIQNFERAIIAWVQSHKSLLSLNM